MSTAVEEKTEEAARPVPGPGPRPGRRSQAPVESLEPAVAPDDTNIVDEAPEAAAEEQIEAAVELVVEAPTLASTIQSYTPAQSLEDLVRGQIEAKTARAIGAAAAIDLGLSPKAAELVTSVLVLSATDLSRGNPWEAHKMTVRDWFEGFLFEDVSGWLAAIGDPYTMRAFRTAMSSNDALAAFNSLPSLVRQPGVRDEATAAVQHYLANHEQSQKLFAAAGV
jgi:hypothetical protein